MNWEKRILVAPEILVGKPTIKGTRLSGEFIIELLVKGWSEADIIRNYPCITQEDIKACQSYAVSAWQLALCKQQMKNLPPN